MKDPGPGWPGYDGPMIQSRFDTVVMWVSALVLAGLFVAGFVIATEDDSTVTPTVEMEITHPKESK